LRHELPELMTGIGRRNRLASVRQRVARQNGDAFRTGQTLGIEPEIGSERRVQRDELGRLDRLRRDAREKPPRQASVAVVEGKNRVRLSGQFRTPILTDATAVCRG
jgi:hypothetical protein